MPTHAAIAPDSPQPSSDLDQSSVACPIPLTPPPEQHDDPRLSRPAVQQDYIGEHEGFGRAVSGNTAMDMSAMQEVTMFANAADFEEKNQSSSPGEKMELDGVLMNDLSNTPSTHKLGGDTQSIQYDDGSSPEGNDCAALHYPSPKQETPASPLRPAGLKNQPAGSRPMPETSTKPQQTGFVGASTAAGMPPIDQELDWSGGHSENTWDFSRRRLRPEYPSATFQPYSVFKGTQQSDRQIYNVEVTILTVDLEQSTMSGYLQICGLTPDHPTLTTFFTGEIIGGPDQKYSFRTGDPSWGASDKTDLTHWARFAAWRPLSLHAKRNINFVYPMNHEDWWQQEHIFMRWKEHFLVPDYKLKSIQGASFEGFYYICLNQVEGRVSGIYFHSKSEKYQQLELKHEGKQGVWNRGVCPSVELR